jgi:hypothetical protein
MDLDSLFSNPNVADPRPDMSGVDQETVKYWLACFSEVLDLFGSDDASIAEAIAVYHSHLTKDAALYCVVYDRLARDGILSKKQYQAYRDLWRQLCTDGSDQTGLSGL